ncbi:LemA family protein [Ilumatobacter sp.]|uniref:LemA family protein n=1 Tax=Ilumatobacter sp. TaxID=1967498 RepID=UPI003B5244D3
MVWLVVLLVIAVVVVVAGVVMYNGLIRSKNQVENAWSQIDVQLKRRLDLVPNLVETVKGYATHERETLEAVIEARNAAVAAPDTPAGQSAPNDVLSGALSRLFALSESYPELRANQNFLALQEELTATEGRVAYARQFYNDSVLSYNNKIESVPTNVMANSLGYREREYFEAEESARTVPNVEF